MGFLTGVYVMNPVTYDLTNLGKILLAVAFALIIFIFKDLKKK